MSNVLTEVPIESIWDYFPAGVILVDANCTLTGLNKGAEELFGINRSKLLEDDFRTNWWQACRLPASIYQHFQLAVDQGLAIPASTTTLTCDVLPLTLKYTVSPVYSKSKQIIGAVGFFNNIGLDWGQRVEHLEKLASIGQVAAGTVNEIRNPLTAIKGFAQLIQNRANVSAIPVIGEYCQLIRDEIDHINAIVSDFLTLAKPHAKHYKKLNIVELVSDVLAFLYGESLLLNIDILTKLPVAPIFITGCSENLKEVIMNICRNAFQAMPSGGSLQVAVSDHNDTVRIELSDSGCGMDSITLQKLFEAFYTTKETGTGLGLSICRRIIDEHGGHIQVTSQLGYGSTFTIVLPQEKSSGLI